MVSVTDKSKTLGSQTQQSEIPQMNTQQTASARAVGSVFDLLGSGLANHADGSQGARAATILAELKEYREKEKIADEWQTSVITHQDLPNGEMVAIFIVAEDAAFIHPVIFAEVGGRTQQTSDSANGLAGVVRESKVSSASITRIPGFKNILLQHLVSKGHSRIRDVDSISMCGCTLIHKDKNIKPNNLLANASNEIFAVVAARNSLTNPATRKVSDYSGTELHIDSTSVVDKTNIHGQHIFSPVTLTTIARTKSTLEGSANHHNVPVGDVNGYIDFMPYSQQARQQEQMQRQQKGDPRRVPSHKPFFVITDETWAGFKQSTTTPENLLTLFMTLPSIADGALWVPRIVNAGDTGFNPLYDFASVGYDEDGFNKPFEECHVPNKFDLNAQRNYANDFFSSVSICMDFALSGPNSAATNLLLVGSQLNRLIENLTGVQANFATIGKSMGRIPLGDYSFQGKKRDGRELLNYFAWAKFVNGDKQQLQRWHTWFGGYNGQNEERVFAERLKMMNEISNDTFELHDTAERIIIDDAVVMGIRKAFEGNNVTIRTQQAGTVGNTVYGFSGDFGGGMQQTQQATGGMGASINTVDVW